MFVLSLIAGLVLVANVILQFSTKRGWNSDSDATSGIAEKRDYNHVVAGVLGILLGWCGCHKFYLGHRKAGMIYCCVALFGLLTIGMSTVVIAAIGFVEGVIYFSMTQTEFENKLPQSLKPLVFGPIAFQRETVVIIISLVASWVLYPPCRGTAILLGLLLALIKLCLWAWSKFLNKA